MTEARLRWVAHARAYLEDWKDTQPDDDTKEADGTDSYRESLERVRALLASAQEES